MVAAANNAAWCDAVCRTHGLTGRLDAGAWSVSRRSPPAYPDAVTLRPDVTAGEVLTRIDVGSGASVKDSFATVDLTRYGFQVLIEAEWIHRAPGGVPEGPELVPVTTASALAAWADAHGGGPVFRPALLADPAVTVLARHDPAGAVTGGAVVSRGGGALGVSNLFGTDPMALWHGVCARFPDEPLVGWEAGADLVAAGRAGFHPVGPLRVWWHP